MVMLTLAEKRVSQRQQKTQWYQRERQPSQTKEGTSARCTGSTCRLQRKNLHPQFRGRHQFNREEGELPEMDRQVEKENGRSRSSGGGSVQR